MSAFIDAHRSSFGVAPICRVLSQHGVPIAPQTYYARRRRPVCARARRDELVLVETVRVHTAARGGLYGARKIYHQLRREGVLVEGSPVARGTVERLMREHHLVGVRRGRKVRTTVPDAAAARPGDLVNRQFTASAPNQRWVVDFTYVATWSGFVYVAFAIDVFSRMIVGWRAARSMKTDLPLDALDMALWHRGRAGHDVRGLIHHSDAGSQYTSIRYTDRLAEAGLQASIETVADSYDCHGRGRQRAVQDRARLLGRTLERRRRPRAGDPGLGRLVQPHQAALCPGLPPTSRSRERLLPSEHPHTATARGRARPVANPGRITSPCTMAARETTGDPTVTISARSCPQRIDGAWVIDTDTQPHRQRRVPITRGLAANLKTLHDAQHPAGTKPAAAEGRRIAGVRARSRYDAQDADLVFRSEKSHGGGWWISKSLDNALLHRGMEAAGIPSAGRTVHALRHTAATSMIRAGIPLPEVQRILGHSSLTVLQRYYGDATTSTTAADMLDAHLAAARDPESPARLSIVKGDRTAS